MLHTVNDLINLSIRAADGEIGSVEDVYFDDEQWKVRYFVVDTGKWLPGRLVLISPFSVMRVDWENGTIDVDMNREKVKSSPDVDTAMPISRREQIEYHRHFGWPHYWPSTGVLGPGMAAGSAAEAPMVPPGLDEEIGREEEELSEEEAHLRSAAEMIGYGILAQDGDIGQVDDFLVEEEDWSIQSLVVETSSWWSGSEVVIPPGSVGKIDWAGQTVTVNLKRQEIRERPEFDRSSLRMR
jgi:sporulation protein YlmC with PRC-barrel domain